MTSGVFDFIPHTSKFSLQNSTKPLSYNNNLQLRSSTKRRHQDPCCGSRYIAERQQETVGDRYRSNDKRNLPTLPLAIFLSIYLPHPPCRPYLTLYIKPTALLYGTENLRAQLYAIEKTYRPTVRYGKTYRPYGMVRYGYGTETVQVRFDTIRDLVSFFTYLTVRGHLCVFFY